ncbi:MAG TPA: hypothetical protein VNC78_02050 [Actinomycetota bacterium]|nr:hypothetical protein [Actinomycetota bacterium]
MLGLHMRRAVSALIGVAICSSSCSSPDPATDFARYRISVSVPPSQIDSKPGKRIQYGTGLAAIGTVNGVLEIAASNGSACLTLTGLRFKEASLSRETETVTTFHVSGSRGGDICNEVASEHLREIIQYPEEHRLTVELVNGATTDSKLTT